MSHTPDAAARPDLQATLDAYVTARPDERGDPDPARRLTSDADPLPHDHLDIRYVLATADPARVRPEHETATLR